jgi:RNA polymerase sigma factor (sigma-70 family)
MKSTEALFKSYGRAMYNICLRMIGNKQDAEDVLQDAFCQAYCNIGQLRSADSFGAWLKRIVINHCIRFLKRRVLFTDLEVSNVDQPDEPVSWIDQVSMQEINHEILKLPDGCRIVFNLFLLENYSHKEIADMLSISESTSKSQYHRAKQILKKQLTTKMYHGQF